MKKPQHETGITTDASSRAETDWTIKYVELAARRPVTLETVRALLRDPDLRDVARVALKYAKPVSRTHAT